MKFCEKAGKPIFKSKAEAGKTRGTVKLSTRVDSYQCGDCGGYHLGYSPTKHWSRRNTRKATITENE